MRTTKTLMTKIATALLVVGVPMSAASAAEGGDWDWGLAPYAWLPSIGTSLTTNTPPIDIGNTNRVSDWAPNLGFTIPLHLEGQGDDWGLFSDILYLPLSDKSHREFFSTDSSLDAGIFELAAVWSPGDVRHQGFEAFGGLRYLWSSIDLKLIPNNPELPSGKISVDKSYADFLIGARYTAKLSDRWDLTFRGDGSFGSTDNTYGASVHFQYAMSNGAWVFGYRYLRLKFGDNNSDVDLKFYGPDIAYNFKF